MAGVGRATGGWLRQVRGLFGFGTVGGWSDGQLLDAFVSRRGGDGSEAAFEELMHRHGPMVLRICRRVLRDPEDAEDAFQATFLVLAHRAGSIRRRDSVASWLFGVSQRVAAQARLRAARRRAGEQRVAERTPEAYQPAESPEEPEALIEEIDRLPERLRTVVVLCYLEGLTYDAAAERLGLSEDSIRGRLARARDRLRRRLTGRGITLPAALLAAESIALGHARAAVSMPLPASLVGSTSRVALGVQAGETAAVLARGVLRSMVLSHLRSAALILAAVLGSGLMAWHAVAARDDDKARPAQQTDPARAASRPSASPKPARPVDDPDGPYAITGRVSVEGSGEPVPGARLIVDLGFDGRNPILGESHDVSRDVWTGADGRFRVELPAGYAAIFLAELPPGYLRGKGDRSSPHVVLSRESPVSRNDYEVRQGTTWVFRVGGGSGGALAGARVYFMNALAEDFSARSDPSGKAILTLPPDARKLTGHVRGDGELASSINLELEWESGFRPDAVRSIERAPERPGRFHLIDEGGNSAMLGAVSQAEQHRSLGLRGEGASAAIIAADAIKPVIEGGKLVIAVELPRSDAEQHSELTGLVLDPPGQPVPGARVGLVLINDRGREGLLSSDRRNWSTTDPRGRYHMKATWLAEPAGKPGVFQLVVMKPGFARAESDAFALEPGRADRPRELAPIRLGPDVTLRGTVLDPQRRTVEGAWVEVQPASIRNEAHTARTDKNGHFALRGLPGGPVRLVVRYGDLQRGDSYPALDSSREIEIALQAMPGPGAPRPAPIAPPDRPRSLATGQPAPEWHVDKWSDGKPRRLADFRGRIVVLNFWCATAGSSVSALPVLNKLKDRFEPRGVVFLSIHRPGTDENTIRRVLLANQSSLVYAIDRDRGSGEQDIGGVTADRYGVPVDFAVFLIDREGKIALRPQDPSLQSKAQALMKQARIGPGPRGMTEEQFQVLLEKLYTSEIEDFLKPPNRGAARP
jgi:RNA polymerase sigma factor (sigma-70 family)